jgi:hypothetical protein
MSNGGRGIPQFYQLQINLGSPIQVPSYTSSQLPLSDLHILPSSYTINHVDRLMQILEHQELSKFFCKSNCRFRQSGH